MLRACDRSVQLGFINIVHQFDANRDFRVVTLTSLWSVAECSHLATAALFVLVFSSRLLCRVLYGAVTLQVVFFACLFQLCITALNEESHGSVTKRSRATVEVNATTEAQVKICALCFAVL